MGNQPGRSASSKRSRESLVSRSQELGPEQQHVQEARAEAAGSSKRIKSEDTASLQDPSELMGATARRSPALAVKGPRIMRKFSKKKETELPVDERELERAVLTAPGQPRVLSRSGNSEEVRRLYNKVPEHSVVIRWDAPLNATNNTVYQLDASYPDGLLWVPVTEPVIGETTRPVTDLTPGQTYIFRVTARNKRGTSVPSPASEPVLVSSRHRDGKEAPRFLVKLQERVCKEHETAEFIVKFRGHPLPSVQWYRDQEPIASDSRTKVLTVGDGSELVITNCATSDTGRIRCRITNAVSSDITETSLMVTAPPRIQLPDELQAGVTFPVGSTISLYLPYTGLPLPLFTWYRDKDVLASPNDSRVTTQHTEKDALLWISEAKCSDSGVYRLRAVNQTGSHLVTFNVSITGAPDRPGQPRLCHLATDSATIEWTPPANNGGAVVSNYVVEYFRDGWEVWLKAASTSGTTARVEGLSPGARVKFRVKAENAHGLGRPSAESGTVTVPGTAECSGEVDTKRNVQPAVTDPRDRVVPLSRRTLADVGRSGSAERPLRTLLSTATSTSQEAEAPPRLSTSSAEVVAAQGATTHLIVTVQGNPDFITWRYEDVPLVEDDHYHVRRVAEGSQLTVANTSIDDAGVYTAVAGNEAGQSQIQIQLRVHAPPGRLQALPNEHLQSPQEHIHSSQKLLQSPQLQSAASETSRCRPMEESRGLQAPPPQRLQPPQPLSGAISRSRSAEENVDCAVFVAGAPPPQRAVSTEGQRLTDRDTASRIERVGRFLRRRNSAVFARTLDDVTAQPGGGVSLRAELAAGYRDSRVQWFHNGTAVLPSGRYRIASQSGLHTLEILPVTPQDVGRWSCSLPEMTGAPSTSATLFVSGGTDGVILEASASMESLTASLPSGLHYSIMDSPVLSRRSQTPRLPTGERGTAESIICSGLQPPVLTESLYDRKVKVGDKMVLTITASDPDHIRSVQWLHKGRPVVTDDLHLSQFDGAASWRLVVESTDLTDDSEWRAVLTSDRGVTETWGNVILAVPRNYRRPRFMETLRALLTDEGLVSFECKVVGYPTPQLRWFKDGQELRPGDVYQLSGTNSLGVYACLARNCMGKAESTAELALADIENQLTEDERRRVQRGRLPPSFVQQLPPDTAVRLGHAHSFIVEVKSYPKPEVSWYHDSVLVNTGGTIEVIRDAPGMYRLNFQPVKLTHQGEWQCVAENPVGRAVSICHLTVETPRHFRAPHFLQPLRASLTETGTVDLECKVIGTPQPVLRWYKDGRELKAGDIRRITSGADGADSLGVYTCEACNCMGVTRSSASLFGMAEADTSSSLSHFVRPDLPPHIEHYGILRDLSLSTINEERTSQLMSQLDSDCLQSTCLNVSEVSVTMDGRQVPVSMYGSEHLSQHEVQQVMDLYGPGIYAPTATASITDVSGSDVAVLSHPSLRVVVGQEVGEGLQLSATVIDLAVESVLSPVEDDTRTEMGLDELELEQSGFIPPAESELLSGSSRSSKKKRARRSCTKVLDFDSGGSVGSAEPISSVDSFHTADAMEPSSLDSDDPTSGQVTPVPNEQVFEESPPESSKEQFDLVMTNLQSALIDYDLTPKRSLMRRSYSSTECPPILEEDESAADTESPVAHPQLLAPPEPSVTSCRQRPLMLTPSGSVQSDTDETASTTAPVAGAVEDVNAELEETHLVAQAVVALLHAVVTGEMLPDEYMAEIGREVCSTGSRSVMTEELARTRAEKVLTVFTAAFSNEHDISPGVLEEIEQLLSPEHSGEPLTDPAKVTVRRLITVLELASMGTAFTFPHIFVPIDRVLSSYEERVSAKKIMSALRTLDTSGPIEDEQMSPYVVLHGEEESDDDIIFDDRIADLSSASSGTFAKEKVSPDEVVCTAQKLLTVLQTAGVMELASDISVSRLSPLNMTGITSASPSVVTDNSLEKLIAVVEAVSQGHDVPDEQLVDLEIAIAPESGRESFIDKPSLNISQVFSFLAPVLSEESYANDESLDDYTPMRVEETTAISRQTALSIADKMVQVLRVALTSDLEPYSETSERSTVRGPKEATASVLSEPSLEKVHTIMAVTNLALQEIVEPSLSETPRNEAYTQTTDGKRTINVAEETLHRMITKINDAISNEESVSVEIISDMFNQKLQPLVASENTHGGLRKAAAARIMTYIRPEQCLDTSLENSSGLQFHLPPSKLTANEKVAVGQLRAILQSVIIGEDIPTEALTEMKNTIDLVSADSSKQQDIVHKADCILTELYGALNNMEPIIADSVCEMEERSKSPKIAREILTDQQKYDTAQYVMTLLQTSPLSTSASESSVSELCIRAASPKMPCFSMVGLSHLAVADKILTAVQTALAQESVLFDPITQTLEQPLPENAIALSPEERHVAVENVLAVMQAYCSGDKIPEEMLSDLDRSLTPSVSSTSELLKDESGDETSDFSVTEGDDLLNHAAATSAFIEPNADIEKQTSRCNTVPTAKHPDVEQTVISDVKFYEAAATTDNQEVHPCTQTQTGEDIIIDPNLARIEQLIRKVESRQLSLELEEPPLERKLSEEVDMASDDNLSAVSSESMITVASIRRAPDSLDLVDEGAEDADNYETSHVAIIIALDSMIDIVCNSSVATECAKNRYETIFSQSADLFLERLDALFDLSFLTGIRGLLVELNNKVKFIDDVLQRLPNNERLQGALEGIMPIVKRALFHKVEGSVGKLKRHIEVMIIAHREAENKGLKESSVAAEQEIKNIVNAVEEANKTKLQALKFPISDMSLSRQFADFVDASAGMAETVKKTISSPISGSVEVGLHTTAVQQAIASIVVSLTDLVQNKSLRDEALKLMAQINGSMARVAEVAEVSTICIKADDSQEMKLAAEIVLEEIHKVITVSSNRFKNTLKEVSDEIQFASDKTPEDGIQKYLMMGEKLDRECENIISAIEKTTEKKQDMMAKSKAMEKIGMESLESVTKVGYLTKNLAQNVAAITKLSDVGMTAALKQAEAAIERLTQKFVNSLAVPSDEKELLSETLRKVKCSMGRLVDVGSKIRFPIEADENLTSKCSMVLPAQAKTIKDIENIVPSFESVIKEMRLLLVSSRPIKSLQQFFEASEVLLSFLNGAEKSALKCVELSPLPERRVVGTDDTSVCVVDRPQSSPVNPVKQALSDTSNVLHLHVSSLIDALGSGSDLHSPDAAVSASLRVAETVRRYIQDASLGYGTEFPAEKMKQVSKTFDKLNSTLRQAGIEAEEKVGWVPPKKVSSDLDIAGSVFRQAIQNMTILIEESSGSATNTRRLIDVQLYNVKVAVDKLGSAVELYISSLRDCTVESAAVTLPEVFSPSPDIVVTQQDDDINSTVERYLQAVRDVIATAVQIALRGSLGDADRILSLKVGDMKTKTTDLVSMFSPDNSESIQFVSQMTEAADTVLDIARHAPKFTMANRTQEASLLVADLREHDRGSENAVADFCVSLVQSENDSAGVFAEKGRQVAQCLINMSTCMKNHIRIHAETTCSQSPSDVDVHAKHVQEACDHLEFQGNSLMYMLENLHLTSADHLCGQTESVYEAIMALILAIKDKSSETMSSELVAVCGTLRSALEPLSSLLTMTEDTISSVERTNLLTKLRKAFMTLLAECRKSVQTPYDMKDTQLDCWISHLTNLLCSLSSKELCSLKQGELVKEISSTSYDDVGFASTMDENREDIGMDNACQLEEDRHCKRSIKPTTLAQFFTTINPNLYPAVECGLSAGSTSAISELKMYLAELEQIVQLSCVNEEKPVHHQNQQIISMKTGDLQNQLSELSCMTTNDGKSISSAQDKLIAKKANTLKAIAAEISELIRDNYKQTKAILGGSDCSDKSNSIVSTQIGLPSVCRQLNECTENFTGALIDALSSKPSPGVLRARADSAGRRIEELKDEIEKEYPSDSINPQLQEFTDVLVQLASSVEDSSQTFDDSTPLDNRVLEELVAPGIMDVSSNLHSMRETVNSFTTQLCDMPPSDFCIIANQHVDLIKGAAFNISQAVHQVGVAISDAAEKSRNEEYEIPEENKHETLTSRIPDDKQYPEYSGAEEAQMNPENIINMMSVIGSLKLLKGLASESVGLKDDVRQFSDAAVAAEDIEDCSAAAGHASISTINEIQAVCSSVNSDVEHLCRSMRNIASGKSNSSQFENLLIEKISELQDTLLVVTAVADQMAEAQPQLISDAVRVRNRVESLTNQTDKILALNADKADIACSLQVALAESMPLDEVTKDRLKSMCGAVSSALGESHEAETLGVESALASEAPALLEMLMHPEKAALLQESESLNMDLGDWQPLETIVEEVKDEFETKYSVEDDEESRLSPRTGVSPTGSTESRSATDKRNIFPSKEYVAVNDISASVPRFGTPDRAKHSADVQLDGSIQSSNLTRSAEEDQEPCTAKTARRGMKGRSNASTSETLLSKHPGRKSTEDNMKSSLGALIRDSEDVAAMSEQVTRTSTSPGAQTSKAFSTLSELITNAICGESVTIKEVKTTADNVHKSLISLAVTLEEKHSVPKLVELVNKVDQHISSVTDVLQDIIRSVRGTKLATKLQKERVDDMVLPSAKHVVKHIGKLNESVQKMTSSVEICKAANVKNIFEAGVASINDNISVLSSAITKTNMVRTEALQAMKDLETKLVVAERTLDLQNGFTELLSSIELGITDREPGAEAVVDLHARSSRHLTSKLVTAVTVVTGDRSSAERAQEVIDEAIADVTRVAMDIIQQMNALTLNELVTCDTEYLPRVEMMQELMLEAAGILADLATCVESTPINQFSTLFLDTVHRLAEVKDDLCEAMKNVNMSHKVATARYNSTKSRIILSEELSECHKNIDTFTQLLRTTLQLGDSSRQKAINREAAMFPTVTESFYGCLEELNQLDPTVRDLTLSVASSETMKEGVEVLCRCVKQLAHALDKLPSERRLSIACGLEESCQAMSSLCGKLIERVNTGNLEHDVTIHQTTDDVSNVISLCLKNIRNELKEINDELEASDEVNRALEKQQRLQAQTNEANEMEAKRVAGEEELQRKMDEKRRVIEEIENQKELEELMRRQEEILARKHRKDQLEEESPETEDTKLEHDLCANAFNSDPNAVLDYSRKNENSARNSTASTTTEVVDIEGTVESTLERSAEHVDIGGTVESTLECSAEHVCVSSDGKHGEYALSKPIDKSQEELCESAPTSISHSERKLSLESSVGSKVRNMKQKGNEYRCKEETGSQSENTLAQKQFNVIDRVNHADVIDPKKDSPENPLWSDTTPTAPSFVSKTTKHSASVGRVESEDVCYTAEVSVIETPVIQAAHTENQLLPEELNKPSRSDVLSGVTLNNQNDGQFELLKQISTQSIPATKHEPKQERQLNDSVAGTEILESDEKLHDKESEVDCVKDKAKRKKSIAKTRDVAGNDRNGRKGNRTSQDQTIEVDSSEKPKNEHSGFAAAVRCSDENDNSSKTSIDKLDKDRNISQNSVAQDEIKLKTASEIDSLPNFKECVTLQDAIPLQKEIPKIKKLSTPVTIQIDTDSESRGSCTDQFASEGPRISSTRIAPLKRPRWRSELQDRAAAIGSSVKLQCTVICEDEGLQVEWFHEDSRLHPGRDSRMSFSYTAGGVVSLEISDVTPEDSGEYSCRAGNNHGSVLSTSKLRVTSKPHEPPAAPPMFTTGLRVTYTLEEDMMSVECQLTGYPLPKVKWLRDDVVVRKSGRYRHSVVADSGTYKLLIHSPRETDSGTYKCVAENRLDRVFTSQHISVPPRRLSCSPETEIPGTHRSARPPTFLEGLKDVSTQEGQSVKLNVKVDGFPPPAIFTDSGAGGAPFAPSYGRLVDRSAPSLCLCAPAWRRLGVVHPCIVFVSRRHCANTAPVQSPFMPEYYHGKHLRRRLRSVGLPTPEITWLLNGQHVVQSDRLCPWAQFPEYSLSVQKMTSVDTGRYTCSATNPAGHSSSSAYVTFGGLDRRLARIVEKPEDMIYVPNGGDVTLSCRIVGEPSPKVGLHKGRHDVLASHRCQLERDGEFFHMRMQLLQYSDSGTYCIQAENQHGHDRCYVLIRVKDPGRAQTPDWQTRSAAKLMAGAELTRTKRFTQDEPGPLASAPRARDVGPDWVSLCWSRPLDSGGAPVLSYRVDAWLKCENAMWETMATSLICSTELYGLKSGRQYIFRVTARNKYGWGEGASSEAVTIGAPRDPPVFSKPLSPVTKALLAGTLVLECQVEAQPPAEVQWHHEGVPIGSRRRRLRTARDGATCRISIAELRPSDSGSYSCVATSAAGEGTTCTRLLVVERELLLDADVTISRALDSVISCDGSDRPLAPFFLLRPRGRRAEAGCSVRLTCQVAGRPRPQVTWLQHAQTIKCSERFSMWKEEHDFFTLEIYPVKFGDVGDYSVVAANSYGKVVCNFMLVVDAGSHVYRAPVLVRPLCELLKADQGSNVTLEARSVAFPALSILWYREGHRLRQSRDQRLRVNEDGLATLQLNRLQLCQSGCYSCTMTNEAGRVATSCRLLVQLPADRVDDGPTFLRVPASSHVLEGDSVTLTCEVTGRPPPQVTWHRFDSQGSSEDAPVSFNLVEGHTYRLRLSEVSLRDSGSYSAVAANEHGSVQTEVSLQVSLQVSTADPNCEESQRQQSGGRCFVSELQDLRCCDGDSVTFQTQLVNCAEPRTILWQKDGQVLENCNDFQQSVEGGVARLCIGQVYPEDQGQYVCVVAGNNRAAHSVTSRACLIVDDPEDDAHVTRMLATREGSPPPAAAPTRTLTTLPTAALRTTPTRHLTTASSGSRHSATRTRAVSEQPCTGRLRGSLLTSGAASTALTSARTRRLLESPRFYATPHDKSAEEGENVTFKCSVSGNPSPTTVWQHDTLTIRNTDKYRVTEVGDERVLVIRNVRKTDSGLYRVALQNGAGRTQTSCRLIVLGKPASHVSVRSGSGGRDGTGRHGGSGGSRAPRPRSSALRHLSANTTGGTESSYHPTSRLWHCNTEITQLFNKPLRPGNTGAISVNGGVTNGHQTAAPVFVCPLRDLRVTEGSPARLEVIVTGSAPLNVVWLRGNRSTPLPDCADFRHCSVGKKRALLIADSYLQDRGHYCCRVSNAHGTATSRAYLSVVDAGDGNMSSCEELRVGSIGSSDSGQQVEAPCGSAVRFWVRRKEGTTVEWSIAGRKAKQLESQRIQIRSSSDCHAVEVSELCQSDQGAVEVTVRGPGVTWSGVVQMYVNPAADVTDSTCQSLAAKPCDVLQKEEPKGTLIESAVARPTDVTREAESNGEWRGIEPRILEGPVSVSVLLGQTALLQCLVTSDMTDSHSRPQVMWSKSGCALESGGRICVDTTRSGVSTLSIYDVTTDDAGKYLVRAGCDQRWASLAVEGPPESPAGAPHLTRNTTQSLTLSWCGPAYDGGSVVTDYCVEVAPPILPAPSIPPADWRVLAPRCRSTSLAVVMATAGVDVGWRFRVRAVNKHGCSQPSREVTLFPSSTHNGLPSSSVSVRSTGADDCHDVDVPAPFEHRTVSAEPCEDFKTLFDVQEELGKGRFGIVYKVVENETGNRYAAKFIKCIRSTDRSKVEDEIAIMNELLHPRLLQLAAAYHSGRQMIMLLEYVSGGELFERVVADDFTLTEHECALFMQQICSGVQHMHRVNIMHLDLKPENILCLTKTSHRIKIIDFGLARRHSVDEPTRVMLGTPEFIPPEIISYEPICPRSDMWSVGVICYILLSGLSPFMGDSDAETFANITRADYDFEDDAFDSVSDAAKQFITGLLHARQDKRMSAEEASAHAWVTAGQARHKATVICKEKLKKFIIRRKWQKTGNAIRALGRMSASLPQRRASQLQQQASAVAAAASCRLQLKRSSVYSDRSDSGFSECSSVASAQTQHGARRRYTAETALTEETEPLEEEDEERGTEEADKQREQVSSGHTPAVSQTNCLTACCAIPEDAAAAAVIASRRIEQGTS